MKTTDELIIYSNSRNGLGIRILGAKRATFQSGIYIKQLLENGLAQKDGRLKIGDQILSINDESTIGVNREYAVNMLRAAAATNQVCLLVRHFIPARSSNEYRKLLFDEKLTDEDDDDIQRIHNNSQNTDGTTINEVRMRRSSRKHRHPRDPSFRHSQYDYPYDSDRNQDDHNQDNRTSVDLDISHDALQSLLNSKFKLIDLVDLLKRTYPKLLSNDQKKEFDFIRQLSETNKDGRITLRDFERQSSVLLGEKINLLTSFHSSRSHSSQKNESLLITELRSQIASCHSTIDELKAKIGICEKSQRLSKEVEVEYEDLLKFIEEQLRQYKLNEMKQSKQIRANDQLIQKLFYYLSGYTSKTNDDHILSQLKKEYQQQQNILSDHQMNSSDNSNLLNRKGRQQL